ncbi:hypothetical protein [Cupriavidus oxalaticus]|uniref:Chorismate mutase n=1 Tax=Cupriavidus oxalaticus TaxID=96344 RepID=A0A976BFN1_9BURK|nr:hypothetical protein [Cupriavidus oxalaticus]QRQ86239.1 hypothetical protein JTE91_23810 [Cupriavidus oxalaticus]QRQ95434.1 hypothetical protein JTE92_18450 [Cupriavidus oxalaticus]WQD84093.1 hypothetical protein U0036_06160 [Cupriavidus oxalaticus]SPC17407.1 hypothetical protein CO2235_90281 [Cupriavidus oxalaticus]
MTLPILPSAAELVASLDEELIDLLYERLKMAAELPPIETPDDVAREVQRMRNLAAIYRVPPDLGEAMALALIEARKQWKGA